MHCSSYLFYVPKWGSLITLQVKMIWRESLMRDRKQKLNLNLCRGKDPHPEVYDHTLMRQRGIKNVNHALTLGVQLLPYFQQRVAKRWHSQEKGLLKGNQLSHSRVWTVITEKTARSRICSQRQASVIFVKQSVSSVSSVSSVTVWMRLYFANMGTLALRLKGLTQC